MNRSPMIVAAAMSVVGFGCAAGPGARASAADTSVARAADQALADQTQAVTFAADGLRLKGTLHVPGGPLAPRPGIVLIHGSGPQSRDAAVRGQLAMGFGFELKIFEGLAEALTRAGYVVLRYDKRTCGPFNKCADNGYPKVSKNLTIETFVADAQAALEFLAAQPQVDPQRLVVLGHSQGATFVPFLMEANPSVRAGVMVSALHTGCQRSRSDAHPFVQRNVDHGSTDGLLAVVDGARRSCARGGADLKATRAHHSGGLRLECSREGSGGLAGVVRGDRQRCAVM